MFEILFLIILSIVIGIVFVGYLMYAICVCCGINCGKYRYRTGAYYYSNEVKAGVPDSC